jgi:pimeloyl-ACP methyl ester carboxylesterase
MPRERCFGVSDAVVALSLTIVSLILVLPFITHPAAAASMALVPAEGPGAPLGAARAKGVIVWSHGRSINAEDALTPTPSFVRDMREDGWDILRFNRLREDDTLPASSAVLAQAANELKASGYRRVVLGGHSFGAFLSLIAATRSDAIDAVIATAPAAWGNAVDNPDTYRLNASRLFDLLGRVRHARVALAFFDGDIFDPGGRGEISTHLLAGRGLPYLVIDRPAGLVSHWAVDAPAFEQRFGSCLEAFAADDSASGALDCRALAAPPPAMVHVEMGAAG